MICSKTPFRISLFGGGTDFKDYYQINDGRVISFTINKYLYIIINKKFDNKIRLSYCSTVENVETVSEIKHDIIRECLKLFGISEGIEIISVADIPSGTGLGSSSTFTVGLLKALCAYTGKEISKQELAELACKVEIDLLKHPIGKQDQYAAAFGGLNYFQFNKNDSVIINPIELSQEELNLINNNLIMFYTGISRDANGILQNQKMNTITNIGLLNKLSNQAKKCKQYIDERGIGNWVGEELKNAWENKQKLSPNISNPFINQKYHLGIEAGATGGKILGAGGGGFILFHCLEKNQKKLRNNINLTEYNFEISLEGSQIIYNG